MKAIAVCMVGILALAGCQTAPDPALPRGPAAYAAFEPAQGAEPAAYRIGAFDRLSITVYNEPSLTFADIPVDAEGKFEYPLIGTVHAAGKTSAELTTDVKARLDREYYRNANVTVFVTNSASQSVTVEGSVTEPGRYELPNGRSSLLEVVALAQSPTRTAKLDEVVVFREVDGQRYGAIFDLADIRGGRAANPELRGGDIVVVGFSAVKGAFRDFLTTAPFFSVFRPF